jgi:hypothetical protein
MRLSRDLLVRGITYKLQERAYGGLSKAAARKLEQAGVDSLSRGSVTPAPPISLRPGTRLVREWRGVTHMVLIHADGIEWRGQRYRSLSLVARKITGARTPRLNISVVIRPASTSPLSLIARNKFARVVAILLAGVSIPCPFVIPNYRHYKARGQFRNGPFISGSLKASAWCASQWGEVDGFGAQNEIRGLEVDHLIGANFRHESDVARSAGGNTSCTMSKLNDEPSPTGLRARGDASASANSAYAPTKRSFVTPKIASPGAKSSTSSPTSTTTPDRSAPSVTGKVSASPLLPSRTSTSQGPTPAAQGPTPAAPTLRELPLCAASAQVWTTGATVRYLQTRRLESPALSAARRPMAFDRRT